MRSRLASMFVRYRFVIRLLVFLLGALLTGLAFYENTSTKVGILIYGVGLTLLGSSLLAMFEDHIAAESARVAEAIKNAELEQMRKDVERERTVHRQELEQERAMVRDTVLMGPALVAEKVVELFGLTKDMLASGLVHIYMTLSESVTPEFRNRLAKAKHIDLLHNAGNYLIDYYLPSIDAALRNGATIRILVSNPNDPVWKNPVINKTLGGQGVDIKEIIDQFLRRIEKLLDHLESEKQEMSPEQLAKLGSVKIQLFAGVSTGNLIIVDRSARHTPRLTYLPTQEVPVYDVMRLEDHKGLYEVYQEAFDNVWKRDTTQVHRFFNRY